ncbi:hypothetical protein KL858_04280 [Mycolicibacterium goodii]|nr:hypothetical protein [Mycolicibacterium goodii]
MSDERSWMRTTAISCAIACSAMVAGPGMAGTAVASADLFGIGGILDIFDHKDHKKKNRNDRGAKVSGQQNGGSNKASRPGVGGSQRGTDGPGGQGSPGGPSGRDDQREGQGSSSDDDQTGTANRGTESVDVAGSAIPGVRITPPAVVSGGGGNGVSGVPSNASTGRAPNLAPVPTAPSSRSVVIRATPPAASAPSAPSAPAAPAPSAPGALTAAPPVVVPPVPLVPIVVAPPAAPSPGGGVPAAPPAPSAPAATPPSLTAPAPAAPPPNAIPESFRIGYADYLRTANTVDLLVAVLPGMAGLVLLTAAGGAIGLRQARAAQTLPPPQIARFMP